MNNHIITQPTPGIVIVKNILTLEEQLKLIEIVERNGGLKDENSNWNFKNHVGISLRGRKFQRLSNYPSEDAEFLLKISENFKAIVEEADQTLIFKPVTHLLTLWYPNAKGGGWHKDDYSTPTKKSNDGDIGAPVYSLTVGNTCVFSYRLVGEKKGKHVIELESGDIIVFGGPQREMYHQAAKIKLGTFLEKPGFDARINLTFRTCSDLNEEDDISFQTENYNVRKIKEWNNL
jgi:alkylated DNA repair dioxygenase AlkB